MSKPIASAFVSYSPEQKIKHMEITSRLRECNRILSDAELSYIDGTLSITAYVKIQTVIVLEQDQLKKELSLNFKL